MKESLENTWQEMAAQIEPWMDDEGTTNQYLVISLSIVYFTIASVHLWSNLTSRESSVSSLPSLRGGGFISETMMNSQQTSTLYGPWVSMHLNEPSLSPPPTARGFLNSLSSKALHQTQYQQLLLQPLPSILHLLLEAVLFTDILLSLVRITKADFHLLLLIDTSTFFSSHPMPHVCSLVPQTANTKALALSHLGFYLVILFLRCFHCFKATVSFNSSPVN